MNPQIDDYLARLARWPAEAARLRGVLLACDLDEALKWGKPCYGFDGKNLAIIQPFKAFLALLFFKGALLDDPDGLLESQGDNTRSALRICFTSVEQIEARAAAVQALVGQAIAVAAAGLTVPEPTELVLVDELRARLDADPQLAAAFAALTPGRQRGYNLFISAPKQSKTRVGRIDKCAPKILAGKGLRDR